jgi:replicative DNA helicase
MIYSLELEQHLLAGLIKHPDKYGNIASFINENDFCADENAINKTIFYVLRQALENAEKMDEVLLSQRVNALSISFPNDIKISDYIHSLALRKVSADNIEKIAQELKKFSVRREIYDGAKKVADQMRKMAPSTPYNEIIEQADNTFNEKINFFDAGPTTPVNISDEMEEWIELRGNNPITEFGLMSPYKRLNDLYGSLLRPGNITVVVARSGVGKTRFCMDFCTKVSSEYNVPVLHFDNGEMSKEELIVRQCSALSGVPASLLETGQWRQAGDEVINKVRAVWKKVKNIKFYYYNVGGMSVDNMIATLRRFYYSKIGRGNPLIFSFDYIKTTFENNGAKSEWQIVGEMVDKFKKAIQKEILCDGDPVIPMITSVQSNRQGIVNNRQAQDVVDDESIVSLSDRITQFCSHMFILRQKTLDEIANEPNFGTHKLINVKSRHLGSEYMRAINPVRMPDGSLRKNAVNLQMDGFNVEERGDMVDLVRAIGVDEELQENDNEEFIPELLR